MIRYSIFAWLPKVETAELLSKMAGSATVRSPTRTYTGNRLNPILLHVMAGSQDTERRLLTPDEAMRLPEEDMLIFCAGHTPIYGRKIRYYRDRQFMVLARTPPPDLSDRLAPPATLSEAQVRPAGNLPAPIASGEEGGRCVEPELPQHARPPARDVAPTPAEHDRKASEVSPERASACAQAQALRLVRLGDEEARAAARYRLSERHLPRETEPAEEHDRERK
jgi:type IV secretory pathway TraG/TraD family ATPase VirD4